MEDTLLFLVVLLPSLIVAPGNTHAAEETVACCKNGRPMQVEEAKQRQRQLFVFYKQSLWFDGKREGGGQGERIEDENKIWILFGGKSPVTPMS